MDAVFEWMTLTESTTAWELSLFSLGNYPRRPGRVGIPRGCGGKQTGAHLRNNEGESREQSMGHRLRTQKWENFGRQQLPCGSTSHFWHRHGGLMILLETLGILGFGYVLWDYNPELTFAESPIFVENRLSNSTLYSSFAFLHPLPGTGVLNVGHQADPPHHSPVYLPLPSCFSCHLCSPGHISLGFRKA